MPQSLASQNDKQHDSPDGCGNPVAAIRGCSTRLVRNRLLIRSARPQSRHDLRDRVTGCRIPDQAVANNIKKHGWQLVRNGGVGLCFLHGQSLGQNFDQRHPQRPDIGGRLKAPRDHSRARRRRCGG